MRQIVGELPILLPGIGAQGGDLEASVRLGSTGPGTGLIVSSSRAILSASPGDDFAEAARAVAHRDTRRDPGRRLGRQDGHADDAGRGTEGVDGGRLDH